MATNNHQCFEVAIVGAGIAGLALAMALHKKGISFTLYEGAKEYSAAGAGIGFAPNGMRAMDLINPGFRPFYDQICVGNKGEDAQHIFFEGMLLEEGLGALDCISCDEERESVSMLKFNSKAVISSGMGTQAGAIPTTCANL
ncbi:hypothetical protein WAI453_010133 [Rhynchosporium graminicola]